MEEQENDGISNFFVYSSLMLLQTAADLIAQIDCKGIELPSQSEHNWSESVPRPSALYLKKPDALRMVGPLSPSPDDRRAPRESLNGVFFPER